MPTTIDRLFGPWVREIGPQTLRADALAGLLGAVLVLPQAIAFAALAGLPPQYGLATAILPCIVAALFGSSRHVMSGPTNANSLALLAMLAPLAAVGSPGYIQLALAVTLLVGLMQLAIGALRLGTLAHFISPAALQGFMGGAAILIAIHALKDVLGIQLSPGQGAGEVLLGLARRAHEAQPAALAVAAVTVATAVLSRRLAPRAPALLLAVVAGTALSLMAAGTPIAGGGSVRTVGPVPTPWPRWHPPDVDWAVLPELVGLAFALTIVALGQSLSIAKALAARSGQHLDANREFIGQGLSNAVGGLFSCYVSCGSLNRSLPNLESGARTPMASVFSALLLLLLVTFSAPLLARIPMAAIGGVLLLVSWSLLDVAGWRRQAHLSRSEFGIALATLAATLAIRLDIAILLGTLLSLVAYLWRTARPAMRTMGFDTMAPGRPFVIVDDNPAALPECPQLKLLRMEGSIYFGAAPYVSERLHALRSGPDPQKHLLVMGKSMNFIDLAGAQVWADELRARRAMGGDLYFHRPRPDVMALWERSGFLDQIGRDHIFPDKHSAIATIVPKLDPGICARCPVRLFHESPAPAATPPC
jgi:SulP family sulfate permease